MFSDDTDEKSRKCVNPELSVSIYRENEIGVAHAPANTQFVSLTNNGSSLAGTNDHQRGQYVSVPKKSALKIGQSSAFLTYVKLVIPTISVPVAETTPLLIIHKEPSLRGDVDGPTISLFGQTVPQKLRPCGETQGHYNKQPMANLSHAGDFHGGNGFPDSVSLDESSTPPLPAECSQQMTSKMEELRSNSHPNVAGYNNPHSTYPYYVQGAMNQVNGIDVDLNGHPTNDFDDEDEDEEED
ncbi:CCT domain, CheY-like superfamily [Artemisia annua]|uniref:CCT domain, CheY-like superfamily n=1 Tax=Artemisia annua TaxID=35608 RepID=A0A2U1N8M7_ARTAN|nr:CCT domain, CheY-like superfamily [Artemisia annua]